MGRAARLVRTTPGSPSVSDAAVLRLPAMDYRVSAEERTAFKRCRREWDLGSVHRQRLQPLAPAPTPLIRAIRDALAVYYYPGMWDWESGIVLPLVRKAFMGSIATEPPSETRMANLDLGTDLLEQYFTWAPSIDDFGPLKIEIDVESLVPDVRVDDQALATPQGDRVLYTDRVAMIAADANDEYWIVVHSVVPEWSDVDVLMLDEAAVAACWVWEQTYLGAGIAGTMHNELLQSPPTSAERPPAHTRTGRTGRGGYSQNEPSGGGRLFAERAERVEARPPTPQRIEQEVAGPIRRTRIRRGRAEIEAVAAQLGAEILGMLDPGPAVYPTPSPHHCPDCAFLGPCLTMTAGDDPAPDLAARFERSPAVPAYESRLGTGGAGGRSVALPGPPPTHGQAPTTG